MKLMRQISAISLLFSVIAVPTAAADSVKVDIRKISAEGVGESIGSIQMEDGAHGMKVTPDLRGLPPGNHAFHIHEHPNCGPGKKNGKMIAGLMAGGHFDPTGKHAGHGAMKGHDKMKKMAHDHGMKKGGMVPHGDLPDIVAMADGTATGAVMSPHLKVKQVKNRSIMVHRYGTADPGKPKGGGARFACGVIPQ